MPWTKQTNTVSKFFLLVFFCLLFRLLPLRAPNIEPLTAAIMPLGGVLGSVAGFLFALASVLLYDSITGTLGVHTFFTLGAFGILGIWAGIYFKSHEGNISNYMHFAIVGTLFFDAATGLLVGPIFYGQSFGVALSGQIPFTALHLVGNIAFAATLSPVIHHLLIKKRKRISTVPLIDTLNPKII